VSTKRERLLDWIRQGDPEDMPVLMGPHGFEIASAKLDKEQNDITWHEAIEVAEETGTHMLNCIGMPLPFKAVEFISDIQMEKETETLSNGAVQNTTVIKSPAGVLTEIYETPIGQPGFHRKHLIAGDVDAPAFSYLIRKTTEAIVQNRAIREKVKKEYAVAKVQSKGHFPVMIWPFIPAVELTSSMYIDQENAIFFLYDNQEFMEELMDCHWKATKSWLEMGDELDVDIYAYAINGYEWLSPDLYQRYMVPQAKRMNDTIEAQGKLSWIHTCGKKKQIAEAGFYQQMNVNVLESLSMLPTGDIEDMRATRSLIGKDIVTRGGVNCELMYSDDLKMLRERTEYVLESVKGFKHMMGDTNLSTPTYPWEDIKTVIDVIRNSGRLYE
jgi:hypothetical protein